MCANEDLLSEEYQPEIKTSLQKLQKKLHIPVKNKFYHFKSLKTNLLPLTNVAFDKEGSRYEVVIIFVFFINEDTKIK